MNIAIIPARGGSKRIPHKNIRAFHGKPIIAYSIEAALQSGCFDRIIVSTDDEAIAQIARTHGAEVPFVRPPELSNDYAGTNEVAAHAIQWLHDQGAAVERACCLYATAPFIEAADLQAGAALLNDADVDFVFPVVRFSFPILRSLRRFANSGVEPMFPEKIESRSQDLEPAWHDCGQFYWGKASAFIQNSPLFSPSSRTIEMPGWRVQDIDTLDDWLRAEKLFALLRQEAACES